MIRASALITLLFVQLCPMQAQRNDGATSYRSLTRAMESFGAVVREVNSSYVDEVDAEEIVRVGIEAMLKHLDPYSAYMREDETEDLETLTNGSYVGFGITVGFRDSTLTITDIRRDGPSFGVGMRIGDRLVKVDGIRTDTMVPSQLRPHSRGLVGTVATLKLLRDGRKDTIVVQVKRHELPLRIVGHSEVLPGNIGYVRLERFAKGTGNAVRRAINELRDQGNISGIVLDLRDNPGGLLEAAVDVVELFVPRGSTIVTTRGRDDVERKTYTSNEEPIEPDVPLAILVNGQSASASEIVAGAIQDLDRGIIIGTRSFGKGLVQTITPLPHDATLKLTTSRYYTPSGRSIQAIDYRLRRKQAPGNATQTGDPPIAGPATFSTQRGRHVEQLHGIDPDSIVSDSSLPGVVDFLNRNGSISRFATQWSSRRDSLPTGFRVEKAIMDQFFEFADSLPPNKKSSVLTDLAGGRKRAVASGWPQTAVRSLETAEKAAEREFSKLLRTHSSTISDLLDTEIRARFSPDSLRETRALRHDNVVRVARAILGSSSYSALLGGQVPADQ